VKYDRNARSRTQAIAEKVLEKMYGCRDETSGELFGFPQPPLGVDARPTLWTAETLATELQGWADVSLSPMNDALEVLMNSGLVTRHDAPSRYYELTAAGKIEAEQLLKT
jgi:hypothetical protein